MGEDERMRGRRRDVPPAAEPFGGDAACWLPRLCADCGAMIEGPAGTACWRCGGVRRAGDL